MPYKYRVWCPDCCGLDPEGCFGGGEEESEETFATRQEAEAAAEAFCRDSIWEFEVFETPGVVG